jgi:uncharacterized membrane protein
MLVGLVIIITSLITSLVTTGDQREKLKKEVETLLSELVPVDPVIIITSMITSLIASLIIPAQQREHLKKEIENLLSVLVLEDLTAINGYHTLEIQGR